MDVIIKEEQLNYVCFERGGEFYLTFLLQYSAATVDHTVKLNPNEISLIKSGNFSAKKLIGCIDQNRFISPPIWPNK